MGAENQDTGLAAHVKTTVPPSGRPRGSTTPRPQPSARRDGINQLFCVFIPRLIASVLAGYRRGEAAGGSMQWKRLGSPVGYVVVLDPGDEAMAVLSAFSREQRLTAGQVTAIGAFESATVGWYDRRRQQYRRIAVDEQCEVLFVAGDVAVGAEGPELHLHAVLGLGDGSTRGGHLLEGKVWPTLEVIIRESPAELRKTYRPKVGLAVIDLAASDG
jgi:predicted DNA-binding protein with PD1-like motif